MPFIEKPPYGSPCNGCGHCCRAEVCPLGSMLFSQVDDCPALIPMDGKYVCGLLAKPLDFFAYAEPRTAHMVSEAVAYLRGAGLGCDARERGEAVPDREAIDARMALSYSDIATEAATFIVHLAAKG